MWNTPQVQGAHNAPIAQATGTHTEAHTKAQTQATFTREQLPQLPHTGKLVTKYFDLVKLNGKQAQNTQQVHSTQVAQGTASVTDGVHEALMPV